jgi:transcriptional regulator GlxA family with amidase domain
VRSHRNVLAPLVVKEIIYRLLAGGQSARLGHLLQSGDTQRISQAIGHLREHLDESLKIDDTARQLGMSVSGFHHHFKSVTAMSPLQFQKQIRLQRYSMIPMAATNEQGKNPGEPLLRRRRTHFG